MFQKHFCITNEKNMLRSHSLTYSPHIKHVTHEEDKNREVIAHDIVMSTEAPITKEHLLQNQICSAVKNLTREQFLEEKRRALLHQNDEELRRLDKEIKRACIKREYFEQTALKESKIKEELLIRLEENKRLKDDFKRNKEIAREEEKEMIKKKSAFRQDLLKQIQDKDKQCKFEREIAKKEQANRQNYFLENFQQDIKDKKQTRLKLKEMIKQEKEENLRKVEFYKNQKKEDTKNCEEIIRQRDEIQRLCNEKRRQAMQERAAKSERIGREVLILELKKQKRNELLQELLVEERLVKDNLSYKNNLKKQVERARSFQKDLQISALNRKQEALLKRQEESIMSATRRKMFQDVERRENDLKNLKLLKVKQYRQDLLNIIEFKKLEREFEALENKIQYDRQMALQRKCRQEVEAEKLRVLRAQPLENLKYLPADLISDEHRVLLGLTCKETTQNNIFN